MQPGGVSNEANRSQRRRPSMVCTGRAAATGLVSRRRVPVILEPGGDPRGAYVHDRRRRDSHAGPTSGSQNAADARLEAALRRMTLDELNRLQHTMFEQLRDGLPSNEQITKALERQDVEAGAWFHSRESEGQAVKAMMFLGALAVAIAWMTYRGRPAPARRLQDAIARTSTAHVYMLPIPRSDPCFCGSGALFRTCHGQPPVASIAI